MADFDIGQEGISIMTNNSDNMFNTDNDIEPNIVLDSGNNFMSIDTGFTDGLTDNIKIQATSQYEKRDKNDSISSDATIDATETKKKTKKKDKGDRSSDKPVRQEQKPMLTDMSGFEELLDPRRLKPNVEPPSIQEDFINDDMSIKEEPQSPSYSEISGSPIRPSYAKPQVRNREPERERELEPEPSKYSSEEDEKLDLMLKLSSLERTKGIQISKHYSLKSNIDDLRLEYKRQKDILDTEASVKFMRKGLIFCTSGIEYMNRRFDPVGAQLNGWGESVMENVMDYDGIFERLSVKYSGSVQMEPEMELLFALGGSAFMFHLSNTLFKSAGPQFANVLKENPNLMQGIFGAVQEASKRNQQQQNVPLNQMNQQQQTNTMQQPSFDIGSLLSQIGISGSNLGAGSSAGSLNATEIGENVSNFAKSVSAQNYMGNPPPKAYDTRDHQDPPLNEIYRKMIEQSDDISITSETSERSIGTGAKKAVISKMSSTKKGGKDGLVIKL